MLTIKSSNTVIIKQADDSKRYRTKISFNPAEKSSLTLQELLTRLPEFFSIFLKGDQGSDLLQIEHNGESWILTSESIIEGT